MAKYLIVCQTPERAWRLCKRLARFLYESGIHVRYSECHGKPFIDILAYNIMIDFVSGLHQLDGQRYDAMYSEFDIEVLLESYYIERDKRKGEVINQCTKNSKSVWH